MSAAGPSAQQTRWGLGLLGGLSCLLALVWVPAQMPALLFLLFLAPGLVAVGPSRRAERASDLTLVVATSLAINISAGLLGLYFWRLDPQAVVSLVALLTSALWWLGQLSAPAPLTVPPEDPGEGHGAP